MKYVILSGWTLLKLLITSKNCSNKGCSKLNFIQESQWVYISISPKSGARGLEKLPSLKHSHALKQNSIFNFRAQHCQKYALYEKMLQNESCWALNFLQKSQMAHMSISHGSEASGLQRLICYKCTETGK